MLVNITELFLNLSTFRNSHPLVLTHTHRYTNFLAPEDKSTY